MEIKTGVIKEITDSGDLVIVVPYGNIDRFIVRKLAEVEVGIPDGRTITIQQRRFAYLLLNSISAWTGDETEATKATMKMIFITSRMQALVKRTFSLSDTDETTAREFITFLIDFCVMQGVPCRVPLWEICEDIERYVYVCLLYKKCAVCGREGADLHHWRALGMGADRDTKPQLGWPVISLCRQHHNEFHQDSSAFKKKYHVIPVKLDDTIAKKYHLGRKARKESK